MRGRRVHGFDHVMRWMRVLKTFGDLQDMTAAEAQDYADRGWEAVGPGGRGIGEEGGIVPLVRTDAGAGRKRLG